jgi:hypothetical protein
MQRSNSALSHIDSRLTVLAIRLQQQERIIEGLKPGPGRLEALSTFAEILRAQHEMQMQRQWLTQMQIDDGAGPASSWSGANENGP